MKFYGKHKINFRLKSLKNIITIWIMTKQISFQNFTPAKFEVSIFQKCYQRKKFCLPPLIQRKKLCSNIRCVDIIQVELRKIVKKNQRPHLKTRSCFVFTIQLFSVHVFFENKLILISFPASVWLGSNPSDCVNQWR